MIYLSPIKDESRIKQLYQSNGIEFDEFSACVMATDRGEEIGYSLFSIDKKQIIVYHIEPISDIPLADGILRSTLHVAAEHSVMDAFYADSLDESFLEKISFIKDKEEKRLDIDKLFKSCCSCGN